MEIKIEKGIPLPAGKRRTGLAHSLRNMVAGDSFLFPEIKRNTVYATARANKIKVSVIAVGDGQVRVWRVA